MPTWLCRVLNQKANDGGPAADDFERNLKTVGR
jgi:hypothetical protein